MFKLRTLLERTFKGRPHLNATASDDRIEAIAALAQDQQTPLVHAFRHDEDREVRLAALARITKLDALVEALADADVAEPAAERLLALIDQSTPAAIREHPAVCRARLAHAPTCAAALAAAAGIEDAGMRATALIDNPRVEIRAAVAESSWRPADLAALEKATRGRDKSVNQLMRERLRSLKTAAAECEAEDARSEQLLNAASALRDDDQHYDARRDAIERDWGEHLAALAAIDAALAPFGVVAHDLDALRRRLPARRHPKIVSEDCGADFEALLVEAEALCAAIAESLADEPDADAVAAFKQAGDELAGSWNAATDARLPAADLSSRFRSSMAKANVFIDAVQRHASLAAEARNCLRSAIPDVREAESIKAAWRDIRRQGGAIERLLDRLAWHAELPASPLVAALEQRQRDLATAEERCAAHKESLVAEATAGIVELRRHVEEGDIHKAVDLEQRLRELLKRLPREPCESHGKVQPLVSELTEASIQVRELRDWRTYAEVPKRQALCAQIEALADNPLDIEEQTEAVKSLRQQWNDLGPANSRLERDLKKRFDRAAEKAFEPCRNHFQERAEHRQFNLEQRQAIVAVLENFVVDNDWQHADWRGVERVLRQARAEWRQYHPVDRKTGRALEVRFEELASDIHAKLKEEWDRNVASKEAIVAEAKKVRESGASATDKADAVKDLQHRWKAVGPLPRSVDQRLWKIFRDQCDAVFETHNAIRDRHAERRRAIAATESLIAELERRVDIDPALNRNTIANYQQQLHDLESLPKDLRRRVEAVFQHADRVAVDRQQVAQRNAG